MDISDFMVKAGDTRLFREITKRFELHSGGPPDAWVNGTITPTIGLESLIQVQLKASNQSLAASAGSAITYYTVPGDVSWRIRSMRRGATIASSNGIWISFQGVAIAVSIPATSYEIHFCDLTLPPTATMGMYSTGNAGDSSIGLHIFIEVYPWEVEAI